jgi:hypothetical protein
MLIDLRDQIWVFGIKMDKKIFVGVGKLGGLQIEYYVGEKQVSPFLFVKSNAEDITPVGNRQKIGNRLISKLAFKDRVVVNRQAREDFLDIWDLGYGLFLEKFNK